MSDRIVKVTIEVEIAFDEDEWDYLGESAKSVGEDFWEFVDDLVDSDIRLHLENEVIAGGSVTYVNWDREDYPDIVGDIQPDGTIQYNSPGPGR